MPDLTAPLLSLDASGTIAKTLTYSKWRGIKYARQRVIPANPNTGPQQGIRSVFKTLNYIWLYGTTYVMQSYTDASRGQPLTNRNLWIKRNASILYSDAALTLLAFYAPSGGPPGAGITSVTPGSGSLTIVVDPPAAPSGWTAVRAVAAVIQSGDPTTSLTHQLHEGTDTSAPYSIPISSLNAGQLYDVGAAILWEKPDGSPAWSVAPNSTGTPS